LLAASWVSSDDLDVFGYSANHPDASGADARHARRPPSKIPRRVNVDRGGSSVHPRPRRALDQISLARGSSACTMRSHPTTGPLVRFGPATTWSLRLAQDVSPNGPPSDACSSGT
jgi:hypothetical protein